MHKIYELCPQFDSYISEVMDMKPDLVERDVAFDILSDQVYYRFQREGRAIDYKEITRQVEEAIEEHYGPDTQGSIQVWSI